MLTQPRRKDVNNDCKEATVAVSETRKDYMTLSKPSEDYSRVGNIGGCCQSSCCCSSTRSDRDIVTESSEYPRAPCKTLRGSFSIEILKIKTKRVWFVCRVLQERTSSLNTAQLSFTKLHLNKPHDFCNDASGTDETKVKRSGRDAQCAAHHTNTSVTPSQM